MNSYNLAKVKIDPARLANIETVLNAWAKTRVGRTVYPNLAQLERFLPENCMLGLLTCIEGAAPADIDQKYQLECYKHVARGGAISVSPSIIGKVAERSIFATWLLQEYPAIFGSEHQTEMFIDRLLLGTARGAVENEILFGNKFLIWVTWNESDPAGDPFGFIKFDMAEEARACLGLEPKSGERLLLFTYVAAPVKLVKPTIADAGLFTFFQPPPPHEDRYGLTRPWEPSFLSDAIKARDPGYIPQPQPEAVHNAKEAPLELLIEVSELL